MSEQGQERMILPTYQEYTNDLEMTGEKIMLLSAVGIIASGYSMSPEKAWDYVRAYTMDTAHKMGLNQKVW